MPLIAYALPIQPGQVEAAASFEAELDRLGLRPQYEELSRRAAITRHVEWIQQRLEGALLIGVVQTSDAGSGPARL